MKIDNYYSFLDISEDSSLAEIQAKIRKDRIKYQNQQSTNNLEAEKKATINLSKLNEIAKVFRTADGRKEYDAKLKKARKKGNVNTEELRQKINTNNIRDNEISFIERAFIEGDDDAVIEICQRLLREGKRSPKVYFYGASSYYQIGEVSEAERLLMEGLNYYPNDLNLVLELAEVYIYGFNDMFAAQDMVNRALAIRPDDVKAKALNIAIMINTGKDIEAENSIREYVSRRPTDRVFQKNIIRAYDLVSRLYWESNSVGEQFISTQEDYDALFKIYNKLYELMPCDATNERLNQIRELGKRDLGHYVKSNLASILMILLYCLSLIAFPLVLTWYYLGFSARSVMLTMLTLAVLAAFGYAIVRENKPLWQTNYQEITGRGDWTTHLLYGYGMLWRINIKILPWAFAFISFLFAFMWSSRDRD